MAYIHNKKVLDKTSFTLIAHELVGRMRVPKIGLISLIFANFIVEACCSLNAEDQTRLDFELRGKAWKVYWLLLKNGSPMSVREVQRALHFSSPSVAQHHLERLCELRLVQKQEIGGHYVLVGEVKIGVLRHFVKLGKLLFPRYFFYAVFSTTFFITYLFVLMQGFTRESLFFILFAAIVSIIFWYEATRVWSLRPF